MTTKHLCRTPAILLAFTACAVTPAPTVAPEQAQGFLSAIGKAESQRTAMGADGTIAVRRSGVPVKGQISVVADAKGRVRVDVSSDAGTVLFAFANDGTTVALLDFQNRRFVRLPAGSNDLAPLGLNGISSASLAQLFLARQPCHDVQVTSELPTLSGTACSASYKNTLLTHVKLEGFEARLLAHNSAGFARRIELNTPDGPVTVSLTDVDVNPTLADAVFALQAPPGM